jgi:hypothetical protein
LEIIIELFKLICLLFKIFSTTECGDDFQDPCSYYLETKRKLLNPQITYLPLLNIPNGNNGYKLFTLASPFSVKKGSFLGLLHSSAVPNIAALEANDYNDYYWQFDKTLRSVNQNKKYYRFLINPLVDINFYKNELTLNKNVFPFRQKYTAVPVTVKFYNSKTLTNGTFNITNCIFFAKF